MLKYGANFWICGLIAAVLFVTACNPETPSPTPTRISFVTATPGATLAAQACRVSQPGGWQRYQVQPGDTLISLAEGSGVGVEEIMRANCLDSPDMIVEGQLLYLPPQPTPTPCSITPPADWENYTVRTNDTLSTLAVARGTTAAEIARANCLPVEAGLDIGQVLYLPPLPTPTPMPPPLPTATFTPLPLPPPAPTVAPPVLPTPAPTVGMPTLPTSVPAAFDTPAAVASAPGANEAPSAPRIADPGQPPAQEVTPIESPFYIRIYAGPPGGSPNKISSSSVSREAGKLGASPCEKFDGEPGIDPKDDSNTELGMRRYIYICNFTDVFSVTITHPDNAVERVTPLVDMPHLDYAKVVSPNKVIDWVALPTYPIGPYTVTVFGNGIDDDEKSIDNLQASFTVITPTTPHIAVVPVFAPTTYLVFFTHFTPTIRHSFVVLRDEASPPVAPGYGKSPLPERWMINIQPPFELVMTQALSDTNQGWGVHMLHILPSGPITTAYVTPQQIVW